MNLLDSRRRTKIVATIGPASGDIQGLRALMLAGMDVARINTAHIDPPEIAEMVALIREVAADQQLMIGILLDLAGPKIRVANVPRKGRQLVPDEKLVLGTGSEADLVVQPNLKFIDVADRARVKLDDGRFELEVVEQLSDTSLLTRVIYGGLLKPKKGVNFPGVALGLDAFTTRDEAMLRAGLECEIDWVALSFVRTPQDRAAIDEIMVATGRRLPVMAKIEKPEAVAALEDIVAAFDGVMVARGDLGVELPLEEVPLIQKRIIRCCNAMGKPVVTATQLLDSMVTAPTPTRAEVNDVANAILDGTDALMLSNETAVGRYPVKAVETLDAVARTTETATSDRVIRRQDDYQSRGIANAISHAASNMVRESDISVIVTMTHSGITARGVSRNRPRARIIALSPLLETCRQLQLSWGVTAFQVPEHTNTDEMIAAAERLLLREGLVKPGDHFIFTAGIPVGRAGTTNLLKVQQVGEQLA